MENSTLAILIAGGILIAMITISIFTIAFGLASDFADRSAINYTEREQIAFNKKFEAFDKKVMYGSDLVSVYNLVEDSNKNYKDYAGYPSAGIQMNVTGGSVSIEAVYQEVKNKPVQNTVDGTGRTSEVDLFLSSIFHCTDITYNSAGWVTSISFASGKG